MFFGNELIFVPYSFARQWFTINSFLLMASKNILFRPLSHSHTNTHTDTDTHGYHPATTGCYICATCECWKQRQVAWIHPCSMFDCTSALHWNVHEIAWPFIQYKPCTVSSHHNPTWHSQTQQLRPIFMIHTNSNWVLSMWKWQK